MPTPPPSIDRIRKHPLTKLEELAQSHVWKRMTPLERGEETHRVYVSAKHRGEVKRKPDDTLARLPADASDDMRAGWEAAEAGRASSANPFSAWTDYPRYAEWLAGWDARWDSQISRDPEDEDVDLDEDKD